MKRSTPAALATAFVMAAMGGDPGTALAQGGAPAPGNPSAAAATIPNSVVSTDRNSPGSTSSPAAVSTTGQPSRTTEAPVAGANSFTEGQAKARMESRGYSNVTRLRKDDQGIWRASATKDGQQVSVSLDYQGNVVAQ